MYLVSFLPAKTLTLLKRLSLEAPLPVKRWRLPEGEYLTFPFLVNLNLLATPFLVFSFGIFPHFTLSP